MRTKRASVGSVGLAEAGRPSRPLRRPAAVAKATLAEEARRPAAPGLRSRRYYGGVGSAEEAGPRRPGFTLIEIVAAMALAVLIMLGMVQVFKMASDTVTNTEATTDSYQMARGIFTMLQQDLGRFSNEGYLYILPQRIFNPLLDDGHPTTPPLTKDKTKDWYNFDTLIFTAVGRFMEMGTGSANPQESSSAEIMYSYARRAASGEDISPWSGTPFKNTDSRGVCLIRKAFLNAGEMSGNSGLEGWPGTSVTGTRSSFIMMQGDNTWTATPKYRIKPMRVDSSTGFGNMAQIVDADENSGFDSNVNYIIGDRVSEFMVEIWCYKGGKFQWVRSLGEPIKTDGSPHFLWCGTRRNPKGMVTEGTATYYYVMPKMLRVTLVIHPHNDQAPLEDQDYAGSGVKKYRGDVFRQVFRLSGVRGGKMKI